jgi:hypothetical protein
MAPITCIGNHTCLLQVGSLLAVPFFHHVGQSTDFPLPCDCSTLSASDLENRNHPCHSFRFITGFYFWNTIDVSPLFEMLNAYPSIAYMHEMGFPAAFFSSSFGENSPLPVMHNATTRAEAFGFCWSPSFGPCSVFAISSYDIADRGRTISPSYYQVDRGACRDTLKPNRTAL